MRVMVSLAEDLKVALDRVSFARALGLEPDPWQEELLRSISDRVLLNCCRQSGKSTMTGIIALHRALYHPGSLILCLAPALRQSQELFGKVLGFYRALDRVSFARALGLEPDPWQEDLLRSTSDRVLLNCCRQSGKSTMTGIIALHRALYHPGSLILCLAPALRQSQELFGKVLGFYRDLDRPIPAQAERKLSLELG